MQAAELSEGNLVELADEIGELYGEVVVVAHGEVGRLQRDARETTVAHAAKRDRGARRHLVVGIGKNKAVDMRTNSAKKRPFALLPCSNYGVKRQAEDKAAGRFDDHAAKSLAKNAQRRYWLKARKLIAEGDRHPLEVEVGHEGNCSRPRKIALKEAG